MKSPRFATLSLLLIVVILVSTVTSLKIQARCNEGKKYFDGCNNCECLEEREICESKYCENFEQIKAPTDFWQSTPNIPLPTYRPSL